jgi:hypothetical protein
MRIDDLLDEVYTGQERISRDEIHRRAVAAELPADDLSLLDALPEGEYAQTEVVEAIQLSRVDTEDGPRDRSMSYVDVSLAIIEEGVPAPELEEHELMRELGALHRTRHDTFLHGSFQALERHSARTTELELEYLRRHPERDVEPGRLRSGARARRP